MHFLSKKGPFELQVDIFMLWSSTVGGLKIAPVHPYDPGVSVFIFYYIILLPKLSLLNQLDVKTIVKKRKFILYYGHFWFFTEKYVLSINCVYMLLFNCLLDFAETLNSCGLYPLERR